jgi:hypothetical protein
MVFYKQLEKGPVTIVLYSAGRHNFELINVSVNRFCGWSLRLSLIGITLVVQVITESMREKFRQSLTKISSEPLWGEGWEEDDGI